MIARAFAALCLLAVPAAALELSLPSNARQTVERNTNPDTYLAPVGVFDGQSVPTRLIEGRVDRAAWRIVSPGLTPVQVIRPLRAQLAQAGYEIVLDCPNQACGGFDFRFATETLPGPNMYVNLRAFHVVTGVKGPASAPDEVVTLLASASETTAYVQIIHAGQEKDSTLEATPAAAPQVATPQPGSTQPFAAALVQSGHAVLNDLDFATGSTDLGAGPFASLQALAAFLQQQEGMRVALVGHTDTVGGLDANISISRARAGSVRDRLIAQYGIAGDRLDAEGMGYLAPVASNLTAEGRDQNRRVEVVLLGAN